MRIRGCQQAPGVHEPNDMRLQASTHKPEAMRGKDANEGT